MDKHEMIQAADRTWLLWDCEPEFDIENPALAAEALASANGILAVSSFANENLRNLADVILPLAPWAESEGSMVNLDGDTMLFAPAGRVTGEARPGWKILRRIGDEMGLEGFAYTDLEQLHSEIQAAFASVNASGNIAGSATEWQSPASDESAGSLHRVGEVPMYSADALCRRATPLQKTVHAVSQFVGLNPADANRLGLMHGGRARVRQGNAHAELEVRVSEQVPAGAAWVRSGTYGARQLGSATGPIRVELA